MFCVQNRKRLSSCIEWNQILRAEEEEGRCNNFFEILVPYIELTKCYTVAQTFKFFSFYKFFSMDKTQHCYLCYTKALNFLGDENRPEMDRWVKGHSCLVDNWWDIHAVVRYVPGKQVSAPLINTISSAAACNGVRFTKPLDFQKNWLSSSVTWCSGIPVTRPPPPPCTL